MINQSDVVSKFASLIGTKRMSKEPSVASSLVKNNPKSANSRELLMCISKSVAPDAVVCTLPSLDMRRLDEDPTANPLPDVGEHFPMKMEASVLHNAADASAKAAQVEQKAAQTLGSPTFWTRSSVVYASNSISENAASSFSSLVESRVRAWTLLLLRHSLTTGDSSSRNRLLNMLASIIKVNSAQIGFKTQPLPPSVANMPKGKDDPDVILLLIAEVDLITTVHNKECTVTLKAPGTISGESTLFMTMYKLYENYETVRVAFYRHRPLTPLPIFSFLLANFDRTSDDKLGMGLKSVDVRLDTGILLESMVKEARIVVFNAVKKATSSSGSQPMDSDLLKSSEQSRTNIPSQLSSGFDSALKLSASSAKISRSGLQSSGFKEGQHKPAHRALKAQSSSLRLGSVLATSTIQKTRSVQFNSSDLKAKSNTIPTSKRQKVTTSSRLTSFKSFGRPHAGDFGSEGGPKNATFGDFGSSQKFWGRDGKLASKPKPMLPSETTDMITSQTRKNANATFDFKKPPIHLSQGADLGMRISRKKKTETINNDVPNSIPRTATALENWLIAQTKGPKR